jgi:hypothetical protein
MHLLAYSGGVCLRGKRKPHWEEVKKRTRVSQQSNFLSPETDRAELVRESKQCLLNVL